MNRGRESFTTVWKVTIIISLVLAIISLIISTAFSNKAVGLTPGTRVPLEGSCWDNVQGDSCQERFFNCQSCCVGIYGKEGRDYSFLVACVDDCNNNLEICSGVPIPDQAEP